MDSTVSDHCRVTEHGVVLVTSDMLDQPVHWVRWLEQAGTHVTLLQAYLRA